MKYVVEMLSDRLDLIDEVASLDDQSWPVFLQNGDAKSWSHFYNELSDSVLVLTSNDKLIAAGFTVPLVWDGTTADLPDSIEEVLNRGLLVKRCNVQANTLVPIGALVDREARGQGLSSKILVEMKNFALGSNISSLVVPVRPMFKTKYPLQSIQEYAHWRNDDGFLYDPWLRVHERLGAEIIKITDCTLEVKSSLEKWSEWTNMVFPVSGEYVVKGALSPVIVDKENKQATYREPNVWMLHPMPN